MAFSGGVSFKKLPESMAFAALLHHLSFVLRKVCVFFIEWMASLAYRFTRFGPTPTISDFIKRKTGLGTLNDRICFHASDFGQFSSFVSFSANDKDARHSAVKLLLAACSPSAIPWVVAFVIVDTVKKIATWSRPHICNKCGKRIPPFAYLDASTSVVFPRLAVSISASIKHPTPYVIQSMGFFKWHSFKYMPF